jgi:transketolase
MVVLNPCDFNQTMQATIAAAKYNGPVNLRFGRPNEPNFTDENEPFVIGKAIVLNEGTDVTLIATGHTVWESLLAAEALEAEGIKAEVINMATIKPLDEDAIVRTASKTGAVVTAEEHSIIGGLGSAVAECLAEKLPTPMGRVGTKDTFGESGEADELLAKYGLTAADIAAKVKETIKRKN